MAPHADGFTLHDLLLTEAVKDLEAGTPLQDSAAMAEAAAATTDREARIVRRARVLAAATALDEDVARLRRRLAALGFAVMLAGIAVAALLALSMLGEGRRINALAAMALLIVPNAIGILLWALLAAGSGRGGAGLLGTAAAWLARQRWVDGRARRVLPAASRLLETQQLTPWVLGGLNHLLWTLAYGIAALLLAAVLSLSEYRLAWETTILAPQTLHDISRALAWLPARLGLPAQVPAHAEAPGASQALGWWLISGTLAYGALPRLLLLGLCIAVALSRSRGLSLDTHDPYYRRLINRFELLAPTQVIDSERAVPTRAHETQAGAIGAAALAVIGFELPSEVSVPPPLLAQADWSERIDGGSEERQSLARRLASAPPARLIVVCHAPSTPDRGTLRFVDGIRAGAIALLLAPAEQSEAGALRWRDWLAEVGRSDIPVFTDADAALRWRGSAHG